jgi:hypothetical protein
LDGRVRLAVLLAVVTGTAMLLASLLGLAVVLHPAAVPRSFGFQEWRIGVALAALAGAWLLLNGVAEGPTLIRVGQGHGLTLADLAAGPPLAVAWLVLARAAS